MDDQNLQNLRHSLAHLLAAAVLKLYPDAKRTIGPAIDNGFYYDFEFPKPITEKDLPKIEKEMKELMKTWTAFERQEVTAEQAKETFKDNPYKLELIDEFSKDGQTLTFYKSGDFSDLCRGGHADDLSKTDPDSFKLVKTAGAYWRGDEKNKMLTRIYGYAFASKEELETYEKMLAEAEKRDHKKLGRELKLFTTSDLVGAGLPLMQPKGMIVRRAIEDFLWDLHKFQGYQRVWTPHIAKEELYVTSGHAAKFGDELFRMQGKEEKFFLKPMNCPHHMQIFADNQFSYRDLPVRYFEPATVYRDEKSGQLGGLTRVRSITQDDGHLFCRSSQIGQEVSTIVSIIKQFYEAVGMLSEYWVSLSVRGADKSKYLGTEEVWQTAESSLEQAAKDNGLPYKRVEGEATFYGPKLDFMFKDSIGRQWQLATIQCDFNLPERFKLSYTNEQGQDERPVVIHRAISGSLERFMGILIEHYAGAFPLWLSPIQIAILPISDKQLDYAHNVRAQLLSQNENLRVEVDARAESIGKKIREATLQKIPYQIIVGEKEVAANVVVVRTREGQDLGQMSAEDFSKKILEQIKDKK